MEASTRTHIRGASTNGSDSFKNGTNSARATARCAFKSDESYEGDDNYEDQKCTIGSGVSKVFDDGALCSGKVTEYHPKERQEAVNYPEDELKVLAVKEGEGKRIETGSDSESDNPFSNPARSIEKKRKIVYSDDSDDESDASSDKRTTKKMNDLSDSEDSDNLFNASKKKFAEKTFVLDSDDSESDTEMLIKPKVSTATPISSPCRTSPGTLPGKPEDFMAYVDEGSKAHPSPQIKKNPKPPQQSISSVRAESIAELEKAKAAMAALKNAKNYHAEELDENVSPPIRQFVTTYDVDDDSSIEVISTASLNVAAVPAATFYTGSLINLTIQYKEIKNHHVTLRIKTDEPLKLLNDRFQGGSITSLHFEGQKLDMDKTPQFYDMENEDIIDAVVKSATTEVVKIHVRKSGTACSREFGMPNTAPLSKLIEKVCEQYKVPSVHLEYNGRKLDQLKSCHLEGIPNNAIIDAIAGKTIRLEFRVNGSEKDKRPINALDSGTFRHVMEAFASKEQCSIAHCQFIFDGEVLQPNTSIESLDLDGGEIIDVKIKDNVAVTAVNRSPLRDDIEDVIMVDTADAMIIVKTVRNLSKTKPKTWKISKSSTMSELKKDYINYYKSKGCKQVKFYFNNTHISEEKKSLLQLGITDEAKIFAMENGAPYNRNTMTTRTNAIAAAAATSAAIGLAMMIFQHGKRRGRIELQSQLTSDNGPFDENARGNTLKPSNTTSIPKIKPIDDTYMLSIYPIGTLRSIYRLCVGTPRQGMLAPHSRGIITFQEDKVSKDSILELQHFSHVFVVFVFHLNSNANVRQDTFGAKDKKHSKRQFPSKIAPPSLGGKKIGVFATRTPHRPNPIGFSLCKLDKVIMNSSKSGGFSFSLLLSGLDIVDGTPILDIKPYVPHYDCVGYDSLRMNGGVRKSDDYFVSGTFATGSRAESAYEQIDNTQGGVRVPYWVDSGLQKRRNVTFLPEANNFLNDIVSAGSDSSLDMLQFYGPRSEWKDSQLETVKCLRSCIQELLGVDVRSAWQTKKARKGKFQAERSIRMKGCSGENNPSDVRIKDESTPLCTQQIDNLLLNYSIEEGGNVDERSKGSGAEDIVVVHSISFINANAK